MKILLAWFICFCLNNYIFAQNIYENYIPNDTSFGERLSVNSFNLLGYERTNYFSSISSSLGGEYTKWKFTPKKLLALNISVMNNYHYNETHSSSSTYFANQLTVNGGGSYYLQPNKFYLTLAGYANYTHRYQDETAAISSINDNFGNGYINGAIGFGRIHNAVGIEYGLYFSESLAKNKIAKKRLSDKSLHSISSLIYKFRNGDFAYKYRDDAAIKLFKEIEKVLLNNNDISTPLDVENAIRLYEILSNATNNYFIYPRYQGFQIQTQLQYEAFSSEKPHNHHANISGIIGISLSERSNLLFSGYFAFPIDTLAGYESATNGFVHISNPNSNFWQLYSDFNNLSFFQSYPGTNSFPGHGAYGNSIQYSIRGNFTHSFNNYAGFHIFASYFENIPKYYAKQGEYLIAGQLDYNIYSSFRLSGTIYQRHAVENNAQNLSFNLGGTYIIF